MYAPNTLFITFLHPKPESIIITHIICSKYLGGILKEYQKCNRLGHTVLSKQIVTINFFCINITGLIIIYYF